MNFFVPVKEGGVAYKVEVGVQLQLLGLLTLEQVRCVKPAPDSTGIWPVRALLLKQRMKIQALTDLPLSC